MTATDSPPYDPSIARLQARLNPSTPPPPPLPPRTPPINKQTTKPDEASPSPKALRVPSQSLNPSTPPPLPPRTPPPVNKSRGEAGRTQSRGEAGRTSPDAVLHVPSQSFSSSIPPPLPPRTPPVLKPTSEVRDTAPLPAADLRNSPPAPDTDLLVLSRPLSPPTPPSLPPRPTRPPMDKMARESVDGHEPPSAPYTPGPEHLQPSKLPLHPSLPSNADAEIERARAQSHASPTSVPLSAPEPELPIGLHVAFVAEPEALDTARRHTPSPILQAEAGNVHKSLPTPPPPPATHEKEEEPRVTGARELSAIPSLQLRGECGGEAAQPAAEPSPSPSAAEHTRTRAQRATLRETTRAKHEKAAQHAEIGKALPIVRDVLGTPPMLWAGLALIALLLIQLFGFKLFVKTAGFALALVAALWLLPLPSSFTSQPSPPPEFADNVGWINHTLRTLFPLVSTDVLTPFVDLLEDALIQQVPPIITSVRCADVTLGREPIQLTSLKIISDVDWFATIADPHQQANPRHRRSRSNTSAMNSNVAFSVEPGHASDRSDSYSGTLNNGSLGAILRPKSHARSSSWGSAKSNKSTKSNSARKGPASRPLSDSSQFSLGKEEAKLRKRDKIVHRLRRGRRHRDDIDDPITWVAGASDDEPQTHDTNVEDEGEGFYVNYEVSFTYACSREMGRSGTGLHMLAYFGWGVKGLGGSEVPVFIDVLRLSGTLRLRLLLSPSPPFVRDASFTFVKMPEFDISARPLRSFGIGSINAMDIPLLKAYVQKSIAQVAGTFVSPRHYHIDVDRLLLGKDAAVRTSSVGVLYLIIHGCDDLPRTDTMGSCDPYVAASFSKFDKPLFSTRTIVDTLDPIFEEPAFILVSSEAIEVGEQLQLRVCDSDRFSVDDTIGRVSVDLGEIIEQSESPQGGKYNLFRRHDDLEPDQPGMKAQGQLDWSVRFFPLWQIPPAEFYRRLEEIKDRRGEGQTISPWWLHWLDEWMEKPEWEKERSKRRREMVDYFTGERKRDELEAALPPTGEFPSGVLQFHVHQCADLEMYPESGTFSGSHISRRKSAASGKPALSDVIDRAPGENPDPPSAYCEVHLNDKYVFRTRTKRANPQPYFNALSERFIRDWRVARIKFVVKDERDREHDPIIGVVSLRLKDVMAAQSQLTRWFPIVGGLGFGKLRISLLFKPVDIKLPRGVSSFETCTFDMTHLVTTDLEEKLGLGRTPTLMIESEYDRAILQPPGDDFDIASRESLSTSTGNTSTPDSPELNKRRGSLRPRPSPGPRPLPAPKPVGANVEWELPRPVRLAIQYRHSCSMVFSLVTRRILKKRRVHALAILPLSDVPDDEVTRRSIPIFATSSVRDAMRASSMFSDYARADSAISTSALGGTGMLPGGTHIIGFIQVTFVLHPGLSRAHRKLGRRDLKFKAVYDAWEATRLLTHTGVHAAERPEEEETSDEVEEDDGNEEDDEDDDSITDEPRKGKEAAAAMREDDTKAMMESFRSHSKALHKRNKGIFQLKLARTGKWAKDKVQARVLSTTGHANLAHRPHGADIEVEHEGQSKL